MGLSSEKLLIEAPVNGGRNYNGPKVGSCLSKIWLYAGNSEYPLVLVHCRLTLTMHSKNPCGADNQQERLFVLICIEENPQRLHAKHINLMLL